MQKRINGRLAQWHKCIQCGRSRWVLLKSGLPQSSRCKDCRNANNKHLPHPRGPQHHLWKGGRSITVDGYVQITLSPDDPLAVMRDKDGCVYEHRLVVARKLGRPLERGEEVHHLNGKKADNRSRNLRLLTKGQHAAEHWAEVVALRKEVLSLRRKLRQSHRS